MSIPMDTRVGAYAVIVDDDARRILLSRWNPGREWIEPVWTLPGGGMEHGEQAEDALVREVMEETGYEVEVLSLLGVDSRYIDPAQRLSPSDRPLHAFRVYYAARITGGALRHEVGGSSDQAGWFGLDELAEVHIAAGVEHGLRLRGATA